jgi:two-component system chemotaxis sensor kinase CheA
VHYFVPAPEAVAPVPEEPEQPAPVVLIPTKSKILLVDDSPFFRNMLAPLLKIAGYDVTALESPLQALSMRADGEKFDAIISDIEMPSMNGFEFARKVREESSQWKNIPLLALTSNTNVKNEDEPPTFNKYVSKFDRDALLDTLTETLAQGARA